MARKTVKQQSALNIKGLVFRGPRFLIQGLMSSVQGLAITKVIQTFVMENNLLKVVVVKDNKIQMSGEVKWIGNKEGNAPGTVICIASGGNLQLLNPSDDNVLDIFFDPEKYTIRILTVEKSRCSVCGKPLRINDTIDSCPLCQAKAHSDHLQEWVRLKASCPICKKGLGLSPKGEIIPKD